MDEHSSNPKFIEMAGNVSLRKLRKAAKIYTKDNQGCIDKISIRGMIVETADYSEKFLKTNCYICYQKQFYKVIEIEEIFENSYRLRCKKILIQKITFSVYKQINLLDEVFIQSESRFEKAIPVFAKDKIYLTLRPNKFLNE